MTTSITAIRYRITLREPAILTALDGDPNSSVSYDFIPGSVLRGLLIGRWIAQTRADLEVNDPLVQRYFFNGQTRFLNGYLVQQDRRSLPTPLSWQTPKYAPETPRLVDAFSEISDAKMKRWEGFFAQTAGKITIGQPTRVMNIHTQRSPEAGRATLDEGAVYRYDALAPHQTFEAVILCQSNDAASLEDLIKRTHASLGGARSAGYGAAEIVYVASETGWSEFPTPKSSSQTLTLTLASDVILRDASGHYRADLETLTQALGAGVKIEDSVQRTRLVGGFNRSWGMPLPQSPALKMGSTFILSGMTSQHITRLLEHGLGERCLDGFGRVMIGLPSTETLTLTQREEVEPTAASPIQWAAALKGETPVFAHRLAQQQLEQLLEQKLQMLTFTSRGGKRHAVNRLRSETQMSLQQPTASWANVVSFLADVQKKRAGDLLKKVSVVQWDRSGPEPKILERSSLFDWVSTWSRFNAAQLRESFKGNNLPDTIFDVRFAIRFVDLVLLRVTESLLSSDQKERKP